MQRRQVITAMGAAAVAGRAAAQPAAFRYEYLFVQLKPQTPKPAFVKQLTETVRPAARAGGGEILGLFTAQLGWDSNDVAILLRWPATAERRTPALAPGGLVSSVERHWLEPTARPRAQDRLAPGGIYVHRWFTVRPNDREEFIRLSTDGWQDFETRFDARIFGLMAETEVRRDGLLDILLLTRYGSHAVWEASRDPTTEGMKAFQRRAQLTLRSRGCSTLLAPLP